MATYVPAKRATELIFYMGLVSQSTGQFQTNPTLASGDVKISKDGGALANLATLPAVTPAASKMVKVTVSSTEMTADNVTLVFSDAAGDEWDEVIVNIQTAARQIDDLAFPTTSGRSIDVSATGEVDANLTQIDGQATSGNNATLNLKSLRISRTDNQAAVYIEAGGGLSAVGVEIVSSGDAVDAIATGIGDGLYVEGGKGIEVFANDTDAILLQSGGTGKSINAPQDIAVSDGDLTLAAIASAVWAAATRTLTAISDSAGVTTLLSRIGSALNISSGKVESNVKQINGTDVTGDGSTTPWGPA